MSPQDFFDERTPETSTPGRKSLSQDYQSVDSEYDAEAHRALVRRLDLRLMPLAIWMYLLCYLDRSNIGNAKVINKGQGHDLLASLNTSEYQYTIALMLYFVAYIIFETPSNYALKRTSPSRWMGLIIFLWGLIMMAHAAIHDFDQLAAMRFLLGAAEAGLFPGLVTLMTFWYLPDERTLRVALILASASFAGAFGGALGTAISYMDGVAGLEAWRWLFILEGIPAVLTAPVVYFCYPDYPETARWLTEDERKLAINRLAGDNGSHGSHRMTWIEAKAVLTNWRLYFHYLAYMGVTVPSSSLSLFTPTVIAGMGYNQGIQANLFSVPPFAAAWVLTISTAYFSDRFNMRARATAATALLAAIAFAILGALPSNSSPIGRYIVLILANSGGFACAPPLLAWLSANVRGTTGATLSIPLSISVGGIGQVIGVWIFKANEAPRYPTGQFTNCAFLIMTCFVAIGLEFWYRRLNRTAIGLKEGKVVYKY